jgi:hypothetical protein
VSITDWREELPQKVRVLQIIVCGMVSGSFMFLIIAVLLTTVRHGEANQSILSYIALAVAAVNSVNWIVVPGVLVSRERKKIGITSSTLTLSVEDKPIANKTETENKAALPLLALFQTKTIVSCALLEGTVFLLLVIFLAEGYMPCVLTAIVFLVLLIAQMPTVGRLMDWMEKQMRLVDEEHALV